MIVASLALSACDSAEQRAERHYQAGLQLLKSGDVERALVEFRNVFDLNGRHKDARLTYARVERERGDLQESYSQYLLLVEQYPENQEARFALTEMAIEHRDWAEAERHGREAARLAPDDPLARMFTAILDYREAAEARDRAAGAGPADRAQALLAANPDNPELARIAYHVLIDRALGSIDPASALPWLDRAIALDPQDFDWQMLKLNLLVAGGDKAAAVAHLEAMYATFPGDKSVRDLLIAWYLQDRDLDGAEAFLRRVADDAARGTGATAAKQAQSARLNVVQFLNQMRGRDAARVELDRLIAAAPQNAAYKATRAAMDFESGNRDQAIAALEALLKNAPETEEMHNIKVGLARMLDQTGNSADARARVEEVLKLDPGHVPALKLKAEWLIQEDRPGDAIIALRTALDQDPKDAEILTLMGQAHERDGARDLAGERYAAAIDASNRGVEESLRYAAFLIQDRREDSARTVIDNALRVHPDNLPLRAARAEVLMDLRAWDSATRAVADLRALGTGPAIAAADRLGAKLLLRQQKIDEAMQYLDSLTAGADADRTAVASIVQAQIGAGKLDEARQYVDALLAAAPQDPTLRVLSARLFALADRPDQAERIYRALIAEQPDDLRPFQALYRLLDSTGRAAEAQALLEGALAKAPDHPGLNLMKARALEMAKDWDGAIAVYDRLYAMDSNSTVVANNLASLLSVHRDDAASLERAFDIARRLRGSSEPAFLDTYGWIAYRRGDLAEALAALEPAAAASPDAADLQIHLGMTYAALQRPDDARRVLSAALARVAADDDGPDVTEARKVLAALPANPLP